MMMGRGKNQIARKSPEPVGRDWSPEQRKIFAWFESGSGNLIVRARAGTGKTTTIIEGAQRAPETRILLAAFNKSIQKELEDRIKSPNVAAKTLHGLGFSFLRRSWPKVRVSEHGEREQRLAMRACGRRAPEEAIRLVGQIHTKAREILALDATSDAIMDLMVDFNLMPDDELESEGCRAEWIARKAAEAIELAADRDILGEDSFEIDFADMIFLPLRHGMVRPIYDLVIVDEAQDMTASQLQLAIQSCRKGGRIAIVGDDRQAIYGFRGADSKSLVSRQKASDLPALLGLLVEWKHREYKKASRLPEKKMAARLDYVDDQYAVVESLADNCDSLSDLKAKLDDLFSDNNIANSVICSTVHKAKGLESSTVFLLEDTFFRRKPKDEDEQHEEENIMYVAVTRSKGRLVYVSTEERRV